MKKFVFFLFFTILFHSGYSQCNRTAPFANGPDYNISGSANLIFQLNGSKTLEFSSSFATTAGPDLHVYLSKSSTVNTPNGVLQTANTIDLGLLKNNTGAQSYSLTNVNPSVELTSYNYVIIHCAQYNHYWGTGTFGNLQGGDCESLSFDKIDSVVFNVYPTLVNDRELNIDLKSPQNLSVSIYSILGQKVGKTFYFNETKNRINTSFLSKGIYVFKLKFNNSYISKKIIIQ
jgi:hypothetical protein